MKPLIKLRTTILLVIPLVHGTWGNGEAEQDGGKFDGERVRRKKESTPQ